jgi:hypothetical protein
MACVITVDGKSYDETGFKQLLGSGFLINEINSGVLKDSKSEIYKQYSNGNVAKENTEGEGGQALQENTSSEGKGTEAPEANPTSEAGNQIPGFEQLTDDQKAEFDLALKSINADLETKVSDAEAFNKLVSYLGVDELPNITNMKSALATVLNESRVKGLLNTLEREGKTKISGKFAKSPLGRTLRGLAASMKSVGISMVVLSDADFDKFIKDAYGISPDRNAVYAWGAKTMVLRSSNPSQIALHEFTHPLLNIIQEVNLDLYESLMGEIDKLYHPSGFTFLKWAETNYPGATLNTIRNEALTELISTAAQKRVDLKSTAAIAANRIWQSIMNFFGIKSAYINIKLDNTLTVDKLSKAISLAVTSARALKVQELVGIEQPTVEGISSSKGTDLVAAAGLNKYMTEDGKGNYVFYHVSYLDLTKKGIDPEKSGSNLRTANSEIMAKAPVSMYYTEPDMDDVGGLYKHVVLIPKNKVYPIDSDPLNLKPQAEKEFRKTFPNISFDNNRAASWIAKIAATKGYDIVVANWSPRRNFKALRAESVIKHKPDLYQKPRAGSSNVVTFNEKYEFESNRGKKLSDIQGGDSSVGIFKVKKGLSSSRRAPSVKTDKRPFIKDLVKDIDIKEFDGMPFVTNMYDYTSAGNVDLGNGYNINMMGGKSYVPYMMSLKGKALGEVSNIAAFNNKSQAESFIRNAKGGNANLFAPHSGGLSSSWQFQQHTFAELVDLVLDKNIFSKSHLIAIFNKAIENNSFNKDAFTMFKNRYGKGIRNFNSFLRDPKAIVNLLDIKNNFSPELRKALNNAIVADRKFQKAIGINNRNEFYGRITDPLNEGVSGGEIMSVIKFDPETFEIVETLPDAIDHHPSFGWALLAKIEGIYQPTEFHQSTDVTDSYTKYNLNGPETSNKEDDPEGFAKKNVSSSAGSIPKVAVVNKKGISSSRTYNGNYIADKAVEMGSDQGGISDFTAKRITKENYIIEEVSIADLRKSDPDLNDYLNSDTGIRDFEGEPFQMEPIVSSTGEVLDGYNRIAQRLANGEESVEVYKGVSKRGLSSSRDLRGTLDRLSGDLDTVTRQQVEADPEAYIDPLKISEAKAKFGVLTDQDLMSYLSSTGVRILANDPASNIGLMAKIEAIKRAQNSPDKKFEGTPLSTLLVDAAKIGSVGGRILRMMRELGTINPTTYADLVIKMIEETGAVLSDENKDTIRLLSSDVISTSAKETKAHQQYKSSPTRANQLQLIEDKKEAKEAVSELAKVIEPKMPVSLAKSFISNLQGNLLAVESLGVNLTSTTIGGGLLFLPKAIAKTAVSMVRYGVGKAFNINGHNIAEIGYLSGLNYYIRAYAPAASKSLNILINGTDAEINVAKKEFRSSLRPLNLLNVLFNSDEHARRIKGKKEYDFRLTGSYYQVFDISNPLVSLYTLDNEQAAKRMAYELSNPLDWSNTGKYILKTITGLAPEAMFRIMAATDTMIRDPNTAYVNAMFGKRLGLTGEDLASFVFEPNPEYMKHLEYQAAKTVFQENRKGTQIVTNALKDLENISDSNMLASALNVFVRTNMPYVKTPANIITQYINYALPFIPMYRAINAYSKAYSTNSESERQIQLDNAEESMSIAIVGFAMWAAYTAMALGGLATAGYDHYDDDEKDIMLKNNIPYSSVNVTAVQRMMAGGPIEAQPGDEFIAIKYFGLPGMVAQMHANRVQQAKADAIKNGKVFNGDNDISMTSKFFEMFSVSDVMGTAFDQSFASGINTIFGVMRDPESKTVYAARGYAQALAAGFGVPATLSKYMEAEYIPNLTDKSSVIGTARNVFMYRIAGIVDGVPSKVDVFGRKLKPYTPEGKNPKIYNAFYPFKIKKSGTDKLDYTLYQTYLQSKDPAVIPSKYQQQDILGLSKSLEISGFRPTPADVEILNIDRGQRRLQYLTEMMGSGYFPYVNKDGNIDEADSFDKLPIKDKVLYIKNAYKVADAEHISEFRDQYIEKIAKGLGAKFKQEEE